MPSMWLIARLAMCLRLLCCERYSCSCFSGEHLLLLSLNPFDSPIFT